MRDRIVNIILINADIILYFIIISCIIDAILS